MTGEPARTEWDDRYATPGYAYGTEPNAFVVEAAARLARPGLALSLGEGEGRNAVYLARDTERDVVEGRLHLGRRAVAQLIGIRPEGLP